MFMISGRVLDLRACFRRSGGRVLRFVIVF